ncbi:hypothetical protein OS493_031331 [Desmophyllum pertusum]|uniref:Uncharacterized protein n=1 Tax=Desmophyllum pertusum TaxID=174260 RepID=A0A9W9YW95_9CNID|nr:hypothetical protein OS493_031331 [Desmophyllum pertusum]
MAYSLQNIYDKVQSGDPDAAMGALMSIADTVLDSNETTAELKQSISKKTQGAILQILGNTAVDKDNAVPMLTALRKTDAKAAENRSGMAQAAVKILRGIGDKPLTNEKGRRNALLDTFDALADNMEEGLFPRGSPREVSNDKVGSMRVQLTNMKDEIVASNKPGAPKFNPGDALAGLFATRKCAGGKKTCTGAIVKFVTLNKKLLVADETKQNKYVDVQDSKVIGIELRDPVNKATVPVTNLTKPLKLTFTVTQAPDGKQLGCVFFDTNRKIWVKEGLIAVEAGNNSLICESLHLTFFAPSNDAKNTSTTAPSTTPAVGATPTEKEKKDLTGAIVGGVIGGLVFIILVILGVWTSICQKSPKSDGDSTELVYLTARYKKEQYSVARVASQ